MYERVLAAVDHSEVSERVLAAARDLALLSKGEVWVLHLREREVIGRMGLVPTESEDDAALAVKSAADLLTKAARHRRHRYGLAGPRRPHRAGPRQHRAQGDPSGRPPGARGALTRARA